MSYHQFSPGPAAYGSFETFQVEAWETTEFPSGWYWHACFPGCLPDGDPSGPFATEAEAIADANDC